MKQRRSDAPADEEEAMAQAEGAKRKMPEDFNSKPFARSACAVLYLWTSKCDANIVKGAVSSF